MNQSQVTDKFFEDLKKLIKMKTVTDEASYTAVVSINKFDIEARVSRFAEELKMATSDVTVPETKGHTVTPWQYDPITYSVHGFHRLGKNTVDIKIADIRGWGALTGRGGLNMSPEDAVAVQEANAQIIVERVNNYEKLIDLFKTMNEYLDTNKATSICNGSIFHQQIKEVINERGDG